jgi:hypothetical protein
MNQEKRLLVHELAKQFGLMSETLGDGPNRFVRIIKTSKSHVPYVMLSKAVDMFMRDPESVEAHEIDISKTPKSQILHLSHDGSGSLPLLRSLLFHLEGQYLVNILNEREMLVQFNSEAVSKSAANNISTSHYFRVRRLDQVEEVEESKTSEKDGALENGVSNDEKQVEPNEDSSGELPPVCSSDSSLQDVQEVKDQ